MTIENFLLRRRPPGLVREMFRMRPAGGNNMASSMRSRSRWMLLSQFYSRFSPSFFDSCDFHVFYFFPHVLGVFCQFLKTQLFFVVCFCIHQMELPTLFSAIALYVAECFCPELFCEPLLNAPCLLPGHDPFRGCSQKSSSSADQHCRYLPS